MKLISQHGEIVSDLNKADKYLSQLKKMMPPLIQQSKEIAESYQTGLILARHLVGGRIYLKWRYRYSVKPNRDYVDLSSASGQSYLAKFPDSVKKLILNLDRQSQAINHRYASVFAERTSLRKFERHLKDIKQSRLIQSNSHA